METLGESAPAQEYFSAVEELFARLRGRPLLLAPRDVSLVKQWHEAQVPLVVVEKAFARFFEREARRTRPRRRPATLEYCERDIYETWEDWRAARLGTTDIEDSGQGQAHGDRPATAIDPLRAHLAALPVRLAKARVVAQDAVAKRLVRAVDQVVRRITELAQTEETLDPALLEGELSEAEGRLLKAARADLGKDVLNEIAATVRREVEAIAGGMDEKAREVLQRKAQDRAVLGRFGIPRIALFAF